MEIYKPRNIAFNGVQNVNHWQIKSYSIRYNTDAFSKELEYESKALLQSALPGRTENSYGLGFMVTHHGKDANFVLIDWWCNGNELEHQVYYSSKQTPAKLIRQGVNAPIACVWDLLIINHERNAWVKHMMTQMPDEVEYLNNYIHGLF